MGNQTATLRVQLIDDVTKPAKTVATALEMAEKEARNVAKAMGDTGATNRFSAGLAKVGLAAKDVEKVAAAWKDYSKSAGLAAKASDWTRAQTQDVKRWESQTLAALRSVKREQEAFAKAERKAREDANRPVAGHGPSQWGHGGALGFAAQGAAAAVSAHSVFHGSERAIEAGAERQHVRVGMQNAGMTAEEIVRMENLSAASAKAAPNMSASEIMELGKEARSSVQHVEEAFHLLPELAKAGSILKGMGVENASIAEIVKGGESLGLMNDPKRFHAYLEGQIKAMAVMGKTITTTQIYEAAKYSKAAGSTLSDRFLNTVMPSIIQEMHGSSAGDAMSMMSKTIRGGLQHKHLPVEVLKDLGMLEDPSKILKSKTGQIMGYKGRVVGESQMASDPDKFAKILDDHMIAKGITSLR